MTKHEEIVIALEQMLEDLDCSAMAIEICRRRVFGYMQWLKENFPTNEQDAARRGRNEPR